MKSYSKIFDFCLSTNIADYRHMHKLLRQERSFAESIVETVQAIILVLDPQGRIIRFNPFFEEISGYRLEEAQGKNWFDTFIPERNRETTRDLFLKAVNNIQTRGNIDTIVIRDGRERLIEWYDKTLNDEEGKLIGLLCVGQDVTERKQAEESLQDALRQTHNERAKTEAIIATIGDGITIHDLNFRIIFQNEAQEKMMGKHVGEHCYEAYQHRNSVCDECPALMTFEDGKMHRSERSTIIGNKTLHVENIASPLRDADGTIIAVVETVHDITDRKALEAEREKLIKDLQDALAQINALQGILPICMFCKKIRDDKDYWHQLEAYIMKHSEVQFTHGICPECVKKHGYDE
jgi:PAS domain S-box-containing protein